VLSNKDQFISFVIVKRSIQFLKSTIFMIVWLMVNNITLHGSN